MTGQIISGLTDMFIYEIIYYYISKEINKLTSQKIDKVKKMPEVKIDWISEKELKDMKFWKEEILTHMLESFDLLHDLNKLEAFTALLTEEESEKLYGHPLLKEYDLLP